MQRQKCFCRFNFAYHPPSVSGVLLVKFTSHWWKLALEPPSLHDCSVCFKCLHQMSITKTNSEYISLSFSLSCDVVFSLYMLMFLWGLCRSAVWTGEILGFPEIRKGEESAHWSQTPGIPQQIQEHWWFQSRCEYRHHPLQREIKFWVQNMILVGIV